MWRWTWRAGPASAGTRFASPASRLAYPFVGTRIVKSHSTLVQWMLVQVLALGVSRRRRLPKSSIARRPKCSPCCKRSGISIGRVTEEEVTEVINRAEAEVFALLQANWPVVRRVVNALCRRDRITTAEL